MHSVAKVWSWLVANPLIFWPIVTAIVNLAWRPQSRIGKVLRGAGFDPVKMLAAIRPKEASPKSEPPKAPEPPQFIAPLEPVADEPTPTRPMPKMSSKTWKGNGKQ